MANQSAEERPAATSSGFVYITIGLSACRSPACCLS